jgi:hypothetical protein
MESPIERMAERARKREREREREREIRCLRNSTHIIYYVYLIYCRRPMEQVKGEGRGLGGGCY